MWMFCFLKDKVRSKESFHGNNTMDATWFPLWCTFLVPSLKNNAFIFPEIFFIQYFNILVVLLRRHHFSNLHNTKNPPNVSSFFCIISRANYVCLAYSTSAIFNLQYINISKKWYSIKKNATLLYFEKPFKYAAIIFHVLGTLINWEAFIDVGKCVTATVTSALFYFPETVLRGYRTRLKTTLVWCGFLSKYCNLLFYFII